jgi:dethiobiotin synthetase
MSYGIFITGTGTGVGKTVVTAGLLNWLRQEGFFCAPMKPVQTGCLEAFPTGSSGEPKNLTAADLEFCLTAAGLYPGPDVMRIMAPYRYRAACSPHLAGRISGCYADIGHIKNCYRKLTELYDVILVEGAGGLMSPLDEKETCLDLIKALKLPIIIVALADLGTINHTLLTLQVLHSLQLEVIGCIFNHVQPPSKADEFIYDDNPRIIKSLGNTQILGKFQYIHPIQPHLPYVWEKFNADIQNKEIIKERILKHVSR